ncbi:MAG: AAA family ATPase [Bdellovibrionales bacterium]|nr:AAA family ATPase [Bdellovibrionales bacterium]
MPHERSRHIQPRMEAAAKLWPVIGLIGPRQSGKTTLLTRLLGIQNVVSLDDLETRTEAATSPRPFLAKITPPLVIDEAQKAPALFDAIKYSVDRRKIPGSYFLTGSSSFSQKIGIRESLTGRIGLFELHPLTLSELERKAPSTRNFKMKSTEPARFEIESWAQRMISGGMPVPAFMRSAQERQLYWSSWLETTIYRDLAPFIPGKFDPDIAFGLLNRMVRVIEDGEIPTLKHFSQPARTVRKYLDAMCEIFLLKRFLCHESGTGKDIWYFFDSGLLSHLLKNTSGEAATLGLCRHFLMNEISARHGFMGARFDRTYYKTARSDLVDFVINGIPFKVVPSVSGITNQRGWQEKPLLSAMRKLNSKTGFLIGPTNKIELPKKGVGLIPWSYWS